MKTLLAAMISVGLLSFILLGCEQSPMFGDDAAASETSALAIGKIYRSVPDTFCGTGTRLVNGNLQQLELWAGAGNPASATLVGHVYFTVHSETLHVRFSFTDADGVLGPDMFPWVVTRIHFDIGAKLSDIPVNKSGNPVPGLFDYVIEIAPPYTESEHEFDVLLPPVNAQGEYFVAAHASVVRFGGVEGFNFYLPNNIVTMRVVDFPSSEDSTYFQVQISGAGFMSGTYAGWCVDIDNFVYLNRNYCARLYSSYDVGTPDWDLAAGLIEKPYNLDLVNWLINLYRAGQTITYQKVNQLGEPQYDNGMPVMRTSMVTSEELQQAIWMLIEDNPPGGWGDVDAVYYLYWQAIGFGGDNNPSVSFTPGCDQLIVFIALPCNNLDTDPSNDVQVIIGQPTIAAVQVPCVTQYETCWADGLVGANFPRAKQWGTYFLYEPICE